MWTCRKRWKRNRNTSNSCWRNATLNDQSLQRPPLRLTKSVFLCISMLCWLLLMIVVHCRNQFCLIAHCGMNLAFYRALAGPWKSLNFFSDFQGLESPWKQTWSLKVLESVSEGPWKCLNLIFTARCTIHSAKCGLAISCRLSVRLSVCPSVCLSVCDVGDLWSHRLEILETNFTGN